MLSFKSFSLTLAAIACTIYLLDRVLGVHILADEPPYVIPNVPYIGHAIGLFRRKYDYYIDLRYTWGRVYIVNSPDLVLEVQKQPMKLSFWFIEATFATGMAGLSRKAANAIQENVHGENGQPSLFMEGMMAMHRDLKPGEGLDKIISAAVQKLAACMGELGTEHGEPFDLWHWVNHNFMTSTTESIYGSKNPFQDPKVAQAFLWDFEDNTVGLLSFPMPRVTCAKAYAGRERFVTAFEKYFVDNGPDTASDLVKARCKASEDYGLSINDKARFEVAQGHAILANTTPTAFWTLYHTFSDPAILEEVREQVATLLSVKIQKNTVAYTIDVSKIREVALLNSILHESLRHYGSGTGSRIVLEDTMLDGKYLLKKSSFVFISNHFYHFDRSSWGPTVNDFDAHRFMNPKSRPGGAFRGFGGGVNLCLGRFFAMSEILAMCAMFALRYEITPVSGKWVHPGVDNSNMSLIVHPPKHNCGVKIASRKGWEGGAWAFRI